MVSVIMTLKALPFHTNEETSVRRQAKLMRISMYDGLFGELVTKGIVNCTINHQLSRYLNLV